MRHFRVRGVDSDRGALFLTLALISIFFAPTIAPQVSFADTLVVPTEVIPPTLAACPAIQVSSLTPYIYDNALDSFEFTVSDPHYVVILGQVGNTPVPFQFFNRSILPGGSLKIHADLFSTPIQGDVSIEITLLSSIGNSTCITVVKSMLHGAPKSEGGYTGNVGETKTPPKPSGHGGKPVTHPVSTGTPSSTVVVNGTPVLAHNSVAKLCRSGGAGWLWTILLSLFALFSIFLLIQKPSPSDSYTRQWNIALILGIFAALLIFWYVSAICRAGSWVPAIATLIACLSVLAHMFKSTEEEILLLEEHPKKKK